MKKYNTELNIVEQRDYKIVKANEIIQRARNNLPLLQLKALAYLLSKVKPDDKAGQYYQFNINDFCKVCNIESRSGGNYENAKKALKSLRDKSFWMTDEDGKEVLVAWIDKPRVDPRSKRIEVRLDEDVHKYLLGWLKRYTQYSLGEVVNMQSRYSFVLFELLESYSYLDKWTFDIDDLKMKIGATGYENFKDFRKKILEIATKEINLYTELEIRWEPIKKGKKVIQITFYISKRNEAQIFKRNEAGKQISGQTDLYDFINADIKYTDGLITVT